MKVIPAPFADMNTTAINCILTSWYQFQRHQTTELSCHGPRFYEYCILSGHAYNQYTYITETVCKTAQILKL